MAWSMFEAVSYAREIGRPLGVIGFLELFFRESIMLCVATLGALAIGVASIYQAIARMRRKIRALESHPPNDE